MHTFKIKQSEFLSSDHKLLLVATYLFCQTFYFPHAYKYIQPCQITIYIYILESHSTGNTTDWYSLNNTV